MQWYFVFYSLAAPRAIGQGVSHYLGVWWKCRLSGFASLKALPSATWLWKP